MALTFVRKRGPYKLKKPHEFICGVYAVLNTETGEMYIGASTDIIKRLGNWRDAMKGSYANSRLRAAVAEYGFEAFSFLILEECNEDNLYFIEQEWIDFHQPEYNTWPTTALKNKGARNPGWTNSGSFSVGNAAHTTPHTEEAKAKMSQACKAAWERRKQCLI